MFRIDKGLVNLAAARSVQVEGEEMAAGAEETPPYASASVACIEKEAKKIAELKARLRAERIIEDARKEAAAIVLTSRECAEEERRRAWQEGYAEGAEEGRRVCTEKYEQKQKEDEETLKKVLEEVYEERKRTYEGLEDKIIALSLDIVKKIWDPAEEALGGVYESLIRNALKQIAPEGKIIIRVSSAEYERFFSSGTAFFELDKGVKVTAAVLRDASLEPGDCIIDTEDETVNAGLDTQLKFIKIAFNRADE